MGLHQVAKGLRSCSQWSEDDWDGGREKLIKHHGMVPTTITYTVDGKTYKFRRDMLDSAYNVGDTVKIAYDPKR